MSGHRHIAPILGAAQMFWLTALRRYFLVIAAANLAWEIAHLPLYTIWTEGSPGGIAFAVIHYTGGDLLIAGASLLGALLLLGRPKWPDESYGTVAALTIVTGLA